MKKIANAYKILYIEMIPDQISISDFIDHIHLNESGEPVKSEFVFKTIQENLKIPEELITYLTCLDII